MQAASNSFRDGGGSIELWKSRKCADRDANVDCVSLFFFPPL